MSARLSLVPAAVLTCLLYSSGNESNFRTSAYEAITSYITHATPDTIPVVQNTIVAVLQRMEQLLGMQVSVLVELDAGLVLTATLESNSGSG